MPGIHTRNARLRLFAYLILSIATAISFWLLHTYIDKTHKLATQTHFLVVQNSKILYTIQRERKARLTQSKETAYIVCKQVENVKDNLRKTVDGSVNQSIALDNLLEKKFHFITPEVKAILIEKAKENQKNFDDSLKSYDCTKLPLLTGHTAAKNYKSKEGKK